jgi:VanZ family protein
MVASKAISGLIAHPVVQIIIWLQFAAALTIFSYFAITPNVIQGDTPDVALHFLGNFLLFCSARIAFMRVKSVWFVLVFALIYGTAMEIAQHFVPSRYFQPTDLIANWLGVLAGLVLALVLNIAYKKLIADS